MSRTISNLKKSPSTDKHATASQYKLFIWDVGTAGGLPSEMRIRTLAAIEFSSPSKRPLHFSTAVRPENVTTPGKSTPTFPEAWKFFESYISDLTDGKPPLLVSHNAIFDVTIFLKELRRTRFKIPSTWRFACSLRFARSVYPCSNDNSQLALANRLGISVNRHHHTPEDVIVLREIMLALDEKALEDDNPMDRVTPHLCRYAELPAFFDRAPQVSSGCDTNLPMVFITKSGKRYHREGCKHLSLSKIPRETPPPGFRSCSICRPDDKNYVIPNKTSNRDKGYAHISTNKPSRAVSNQFFITKFGKRYHVEGCKSLSQSKIPVDNPPEGYGPCGLCLKNSGSSPPLQDDSKFTSLASPEDKKDDFEDAPYFVTNRGSCYHIDGCSCLSQSRIPKNEPPSGYRPCGKCLPDWAYGGSPQVKKISK